MHMLTKTRTGLKPGREGRPDYDAAAEFSGVTHDLSAAASFPPSEVTTLRRRPSKGHNCKVIPPPFPPRLRQSEA